MIIQREIKFKIFDKNIKQMGKIFSLKQAMSEKPFEMLDTDIVMQYTGLKDKNSKECFEGDIVKNGDFVADADSWNEWIREVEWIDEEAKFIGVAEGERWEIIGNIYENSELLNR